MATDRWLWAWGLAAVALTLAVLPFTTATWLIVAGNAVVWFAAGAAAPVLTLLVIGAAGRLAESYDASSSSRSVRSVGRRSIRSSQ